MHTPGRLVNTMMPSRSDSRVVLAGVASYRSMPRLPNVLNNLTDLHAALTGDHGAFDDATITLVADPVQPADLLTPLARAAKQATDTLVFYFAGHGVRDMSDALCLALPGTIDRKADALRTALPVEAVAAILNASPARRRIVILDCCFSGLVMRAPSAFNLHLLTATSRTEKAKALPEHRNTEFTAHLLELLKNGVPDCPDTVDIGTIYNRLHVTLSAADLPKPHQRTVDRSADTAIARNRGVSLRRRAWFAEQVGHAGDPVAAARMFTAIVAADESQLDYRKSEAAWTGTSGDVAGAVGKWERLRADVLASLSTHSDGGRELDPDHRDAVAFANLDEISQSIMYWSARL